MQAIGAAARREGRVVGDQKKEIVSSDDIAKARRQCRPFRIVARAQNDEAAARQGGCGGDGIGQAFVIRHQDQGRQRGRRGVRAH